MSIISILKKIKRRLLQKSRLKEVTQNMYPHILASADYKNNDIKQCFSPRLLPTPDKTVISRILKAYNKAKAIQKDLPQAYQVGNEWLPIYQMYMNDIMQALSTFDATATNKLYEDFMRGECSFGLHGLPVNMQQTYFNNPISKEDAVIYLHDAIYRYQHWRELTSYKYKASDLYMPDFGNPYGYYIDNEFIRTGAEYLQYYAERIAELIENKEEKKVVIELGGGYGGLGYFLNKIIPDFTYVDFDLPENMALTAYYLMCIYPEKKVLLYGEDDFNGASFDKYDIIIMPNFEIAKLPTAQADLVFNSYSLAEMSTETINAYIPELKRASKKYIFHVNHSEVSSSLKADDFGIDDDVFKLISKKPALWNMGRNIHMDEYEYLYTKTTGPVNLS